VAPAHSKWTNIKNRAAWPDDSLSEQRPPASQLQHTSSSSRRACMSAPVFLENYQSHQALCLGRLAPPSRNSAIALTFVLDNESGQAIIYTCRWVESIRRLGDTLHESRFGTKESRQGLALLSLNRGPNPTRRVEKACKGTFRHASTPSAPPDWLHSISRLLPKSGTPALPLVILLESSGRCERGLLDCRNLACLGFS